MRREEQHRLKEQRLAYVQQHWGRPVHEIAEALDVLPVTVRKWAKEMGLLGPPVLPARTELERILRDGPRNEEEERIADCHVQAELDKVRADNSGTSRFGPPPTPRAAADDDDDRGRRRRLQDRWLAVPSVRYQIDHFGEEQPIMSHLPGSPTFRDVRTRLLPNWEAWFTEFLQGER